MKNANSRLLGLWFLLSMPTIALGEAASVNRPTALADFVRPFVGTKGEGNTYPGPSAPFGMIQLGPDTEKELWETASGYEYSDTTIMGFSLTHLTGTGIPDLGDFLFVPQTGQPMLVPGTKSNPDSGYQSRYFTRGGNGFRGLLQGEAAKIGCDGRAYGRGTRRHDADDLSCQ
jgi:putative alpha-1,2-mannosidase